jgi:hypothetical protein
VREILFLSKTGARIILPLLVAGAVGTGQLLAATFTTLDDPLATSGTIAAGIFGNKIVGIYNLPQVGEGFLFDGSSYSTIAGPNSLQLLPHKIEGNNIVGQYFTTSNTGLISHGFLYDGSTLTTLDVPAGNFTYAAGISGANIVGEYDVGLAEQRVPVHGFLRNWSSLAAVCIV